MTAIQRHHLSAAKRDCLLLGADPGLVDWLADREEVGELQILAERLLRATMSEPPSTR